MAAILAPSSSRTMPETESGCRALVPRARGGAHEVEIGDRVCVDTDRDRGQRARYYVRTIAHAGCCQRKWNPAVPI
jgi:hypothetical protein